MSDLATILKQVGPWALLLLAVLYVAIKHIIPFLQEQRRKEQEFQHNQILRIQNREDQIIKELTVAIQQNTRASEKQSQGFDALVQEIRAARSK